MQGGGRIATPPHPLVNAALAASATPRRGFSFSSPPHYSCCAEPRRSATWPMINAAGCRAKSSPFGGTIVTVRWRACRRRPGPGGPPCGGVTRGAAPGSGVGGGGGSADFAVLPPLPLCWAEYASVTAGQTPGVTDQDLHRLEAWLSNRRRLTGVIRAGPLLRSWPGGHLARPWRGAGGGMVQRPPRGVGCVYCYCGRWLWLWRWCVKVS
jgi:hypothetical protein